MANTLIEFLETKREIKIYFRLYQVLFAFLSLFLAAYISWEAYWYSKVGLAFIKWHTHLAFVLFVFSTLGLFLFFLKQWVKAVEANFEKLVLLVISTFLGVFLLELIFVLTPLLKTKYEINYGYYTSAFVVDEDNVHHTWENSATHVLHQKEFSYIRHTNKLGYSDKEWNQKDTTKIKILCIGDSFTEGDGAPYDSAYPSILQNILDDKYPSKYEVLNAGTCGSDPFFGYKAYIDQLYKLKPSIILQTVSTHDIEGDYSMRGGLERFTAENKLQYKKSTRTKFEFLYAISYISRIVFNLCGFDYSGVSFSYDSELMRYDFKGMFSMYDSVATSKSSSLILLLLPMRHEVKDQKYNLDFSFLKKFNPIDLMPLYSSVEVGASTYKNYYWEEDAHHNPKGYAKMAQAIELGLSQNGLLNQADSLTANHTYQTSNTDSQIPNP